MDPRPEMSSVSEPALSSRTPRTSIFGCTAPPAPRATATATSARSVT
jgi:hypothetical protein